VLWLACITATAGLGAGTAFIIGVLVGVANTLGCIIGGHGAWGVPGVTVLFWVTVDLGVMRLNLPSACLTSC
jgi:hypothetical protein